MFTPATSRHFEKRVNEKSGVPYYVLKTHVAPYQQAFYFVNDSMTADGRYLWFYAAYPPIHRKLLGVVDFESDTVNVFPDGAYDTGSPYIDVLTGDAYFPFGNDLFKRTPDPSRPTERLCTVPTKGLMRRFATHLTVSPDGNEFFLDIAEGNRTWYVGSLDRKTYTFTKWCDAPFCTNHGQFNPVNGDLALCAYDFTTDILTGEKLSIPYDENGVYQRLWTVTRDGRRTTYPPIDNYATHEWWSADGKKIYYVNPKGIQRLDLSTGEHKTIHACVPWHAFSTRDETYYVFDVVLYDRFPVWYRGCPSAVRFWNAETDVEIDIATRLPENGYTPEHPCDYYHIDPHPRFVGNERYIVYTTTENGGVDLAIAETADLVRLTSAK